MKYNFFNQTRCLTFDSFIFHQGNTFAIHRLSGCSLSKCPYPARFCNNCEHEL